MSQALVWGGIAVVFLGVIWGRIVLSAALDCITSRFPEVFRMLSDYGTPVLKKFSSEDKRVSRALAAKMLTGALPANLRADPQFAAIQRSWRMAVLAMAGGFGLVAIGFRLAGAA
ncbi:hypothetical protein M1105_13380 [Limibaculum sp. FT325]|uniref:hypothetical protein n=1 Tax=Thermohalobaculum sediminis TaxID=2939436 RepID=UPI0020C0B5AA|nr:hypothetical protein [Limibaculum sediminis]MCL5777975.1 hypothetical protein [Limibaculum sediminis]